MVECGTDLESSAPLFTDLTDDDDDVISDD